MIFFSHWNIDEKGWHHELSLKFGKFRSYGAIPLIMTVNLTNLINSIKNVSIRCEFCHLTKEKPLHTTKVGLFPKVKRRLKTTILIQSLYTSIRNQCCSLRVVLFWKNRFPEEIQQSNSAALRWLLLIRIWSVLKSCQISTMSFSLAQTSEVATIYKNFLFKLRLDSMSGSLFVFVREYIANMDDSSILSSMTSMMQQFYIEHRKHLWLFEVTSVFQPCFQCFPTFKPAIFGLVHFNETMMNQRWEYSYA